MAQDKSAGGGSAVEDSRVLPDTVTGRKPLRLSVRKTCMPFCGLNNIRLAGDAGMDGILNSPVLFRKTNALNE